MILFLWLASPEYKNGNSYYYLSFFSGLKNRKNYFNELDNKLFLERYRLSKQCVTKLLELIDSELEYIDDRNHPLTPIEQLLITLRFYATGSYQLAIADLHGVSRSTVCRYIKKVSIAIARLRNKFIKWPEQNDALNVKTNFFKIAGFPCIIGAIDCTHIPIRSPGGEQAELYRNRKGYMSINVQAICDANLLLTDLVVRWPGSVHDSTIFSNSYCRAQFETGMFSSSDILLGDGGYALKSFLMTPLLNPITQGEVAYNAAHIKTRNVIERTFGVWKRRFPILKLGLGINLQTSLTVIVATGILHNIAILTRDEEPSMDIELYNSLDLKRRELLMENNEIQAVNVQNIPLNGNAEMVRRNIILNNFTII